MILAVITQADGDEFTMPFEDWETLGLWMEDHAGSYTGVKAKGATSERPEERN